MSLHMSEKTKKDFFSRAPVPWEAGNLLKMCMQQNPYSSVNGGNTFEQFKTFKV